MLIKGANLSLLQLEPDAGGSSYAMTTPRFEAAMGKYGWLIQLIFAGTVAPGDGKVPSVRQAISKLV